jgi:hypothetical protein
VFAAHVEHETSVGGVQAIAGEVFMGRVPTQAQQENKRKKEKGH